MLIGWYAEATSLIYTRFCNPLRLHHHGEGEKAYLPSAQKRRALGRVPQIELYISWRFVKASRQFHFLTSFAITRKRGKVD